MRSAILSLKVAEVKHFRINHKITRITVYLCLMLRLLLIFLCCCACAALLRAQTAANPFELSTRLSKSDSNGVAIPLIVNPFDVMKHRVPGASKALVENETTPFRPFSILPRGSGLQQSTLFWVLMLMFGFLTFSVAANRKVVGKAWRGFLNDSSLTSAQREAAGFIGSTPYYLMYASFLLQAGMFIFLVVRFFNPKSFNNLPFLMLCMVGALVVFLSKHLMLSMAGWLYPLGNTVQRYNFLIIVFNCILGLFLIPFNLLLAFGGDLEGLLVFWTLGLVAIFYIYRSIRASSIGSKYFADDQFHFLLYLCTVEIAPVLFIVKLAMIQAN